jgi:hypothetical protein
VQAVQTLCAGRCVSYALPFLGGLIMKQEEADLPSPAPPWAFCYVYHEHCTAVEGLHATGCSHAGGGDARSANFSPEPSGLRLASLAADVVMGVLVRPGK